MARSEIPPAWSRHSLLSEWTVVCLCVLGALMGRHCAAAERVVLISVDGMRPDAIEAAGADSMRALIAAGSYHPMAVNELPPATLPNHTSMVTGLSVAAHGVLANTDIPGVVEARTIFDVATDAGLSCGFFASKSKLAFLAPAEALAVTVIETDVTALMDQVLEEMSVVPLDLTFIHIRSPDSVGHGFGWMSAEYLGAVKSADEQIGRLVDRLSELELLETTDIIITADHGGEGFGHVLNTPAVRLIPWIGFGPDFAVGRTLCDTVSMPDTAATVLMALGLPVPADWQGQPVAEAMAETPQADCQPIEPFLGTPCMLFPMLLAAAMVGVFGRRQVRIPPNRRAA